MHREAAAAAAHDDVREKAPAEETHRPLSTSGNVAHQKKSNIDNSSNNSHDALPHDKRRVVSVEVIVKKIGPLGRLPEDQLRRLVNSYDEDNAGGLTEEQWTRFCRENQKHIASLGVEMLDYDRSGEYTFITVERAGDENGKGAPASFPQGLVRFLEGFAAGGIAGAVSKTVIAPGDRVKIIFQVESKRHFSLREAAYLGAETVREFGVTGLWIGNGATMLRVVPYAAITYASFDYYQRTFSALAQIRNEDGVVNEHRAVYVRFISGALAGATSTTCTYPLDLMRARFAARSSSGKTRFPSYRVAFREATAKNGISSLYGGLFPTLVGIVPYAGCSFACFETIKSHIVKSNNLKSDRDIPSWQRLVAGGFSGLVAQSATYPLDIVRRRMQVSPGRYPTILHALISIYREEGLRQGWYKGLAMNWIKGPIATATSFTVNDLIKRRTSTYHESVVASHASAPRRGPVVTVPEAFVCGGVAAGLAKFWTIPFDKLKIMYQLGITDGGGKSKSCPQMGLRHLSHMLRRNPNMWTSAHITMTRVIPYGALTYSFFDIFQVIAERLTYSHEATLLSNFMAGGAAAALGTLIVYPLDLVRTRSVAMNSSTWRFQSYFWLFRAMARRHGMASLYEGCRLAMMGVGLLAGIGFATYQHLKTRFHCETFGERLVAGMAAGLVGQVITYPLSVAKRSRQAEMVVYSRTATPTKSLFLKPNLLATLYRKMPFSWSLSSLTFGISFALNDCCRDLVAKTRGDILHDIIFSPSSQDDSQRKSL